MEGFPWHYYWLAFAVVSLVAGALGFVILFGLATWYCWPR